MELVLSPGRLGGETNAGSPFHNQEIREWSHVDRLTGMLEHARVETGRWEARHQGTAQAYGKVIDSRERNSADGNVVQKARRQVEVFQSQGIGGRSVQVVRASQWSSSRITDSSSSSPVSVSMNDVSQLRNGNDDKSANVRLSGDESLAKLSQVSRLCRQINGETLMQSKRLIEPTQRSPVFGDRFATKFDGFGGFVRKDDRTRLFSGGLIANGLRSTSSDDLTQSVSDSSTKSLTVFDRDCKARRSLQIPRSSVAPDLEENVGGSNEIRPNPEGMEFSRNSQSPSDDASLTKNDRKRVRSYVLGMAENEGEGVISSLIPLARPIHEKKILFNGAFVDGNVNDTVVKSDYPRPTPIVLRAKPNTTVVHLNNKPSPGAENDSGVETDAAKTATENETASLRPIVGPAMTSRVQSLASRFSNGVKFPSQNTFQQAKKQTIVDGSGSRIEGLINRSTVLQNGTDSQNSVETFPHSERRGAEDPGTVTPQVRPVKRVGFCKTEVHFAAESGKVNIVETDCKPPPSNRFRRRRRGGVIGTGGAPIAAQNRNLPLIHFGDTSYEKYIFGQSNGSLKPDDFAAKDKPEPDDTGAEIDPVISSKDQRLAPDEFGVRDGWRARLKTIMRSEPPTLIEPIDDECDDVTAAINGAKNFDAVDETIVDHSFRGSHTTTVNLGADVISKIRHKHANEGKCNTISTGIQLQFNTRLEKVTGSVSRVDTDVAMNNLSRNAALAADKNRPPYSIVVSAAVSTMPRPLIQAQQSAVLKSAHLVMNLNRIKNFGSIVKTAENNNKALSTRNERNENSLALKQLISSLRDNQASTLIGINANDPRTNRKNYRAINGTALTTRFAPLGLRHSNQYVEPRRGVEDPDDGGEGQTQYSSGSEQADEEVRSYMLGSKTHRSYTQSEKFTGSRTPRMEEVRKTEEEEPGGSIVKRDTGENDDSIDNINENEIVDDESDSIANSGLPEEEVCFEANRTVEKTRVPDLHETPSDSCNVVTSDNENNKVLMNVVTTHEPVIIARVEDRRSPDAGRELLFAGKKSRSDSATRSVTERKGKGIFGETNRGCDKPFTSAARKQATVKPPPKVVKDRRCDKKTGNETAPGINSVDDAASDPTYVNVFENGKRSAPIYENYRVARCRRNGDVVGGKKHPRNVPGTETNAATDPDAAGSVNGDCNEAEAKLTGADSGGEKSRDTDADAKPLQPRVSDESGGRKNREGGQRALRSGKTVRNKKFAGPLSSASSAESLHRANSANENSKDSELARPLHAKSTRSSRLHRATSGNETSRESAARYSATNDKKKCSLERTNERSVTSGGKLLPTRSSHVAVDAVNAAKNEQGSKNLNDSTRSKKPIEIVYQTAVFNMKNEKLTKSSKSKESKTPRYINDLICGGRPKRSSADVRHVKGTSLSQQRTHRKSASPTNRHWK